MSLFKTIFPIFLLLAGLSLNGVVYAQQPDFSQVQIKTHKVRDNIYMLEGMGGNIGLFVGADGAFLIDDQFAPLTDKIVTAVRRITDKEIRFLVNTHIHGDHVGGNENLGRLGVLIFAHKNVRKRLSDGPADLRTGGQLPPSAEAALPIVTYDEGVEFHINGDRVHVFPVPPAHTDGDSYIHFTRANVLHLGDVFRTNSYPIIDVGNGGTFNGIIEGLNMAIDLSDDETRIIPGHGVVSDRKMLIQVRDMYLDIRGKVLTLIGAGKTLEQVLAAGPTRDYDDRWEPQQGRSFGSAERFITALYNELKQP